MTVADLTAATIAGLHDRRRQVVDAVQQLTNAGVEGPYWVRGHPDDVQGLVATQGLPVVADASVTLGCYVVEPAADGSMLVPDPPRPARPDRRPSPGPPRRAAPPPQLPDPTAPHTWLRTDPHPTEHVAAVLALPRSGTDRAHILDMIATADRGLTTDEVSRRMATEHDRPDRPNQHAARVLELVEAGWIEDSGRTRRTRSGADAIVWTLTDVGREQWGR